MQPDLERLSGLLGATGHESGENAHLPPMQEASARAHRVHPCLRIMRIHPARGGIGLSLLLNQGTAFAGSSGSRPGYLVWPARMGISESETHPIRVVRVVVVVRVAACVAIHEVVRIVDVGIALPPVRAGTRARSRDKPGLRTVSRPRLSLVLYRFSPAWLGSVQCFASRRCCPSARRPRWRTAS